MTVRALSIAPYAHQLLAGPQWEGVGLGHGYILFGDRVLALTPTGQPRMPNGIETDLVVAEGEPVTAGGGSLTSASGTIERGPMWNPRPLVRVTLSLRPRPRLHLHRFIGRGPGLTPLGDDILIGYLAAGALSGTTCDLTKLAAYARRRTSALSATLLELAAGGALPEPAHSLLADGNPEPLFHFGASSGRGIAFGLALFEAPVSAAASNERTISLGESELVMSTPVATPARRLGLARV